MTDISLAIAKILKRRDELRKLLDAGIAENVRASDLEAHLLAEYERSYALAYLQADGPVKERECKAKLQTMDVFEELQMAKALRRSSLAALQAREQDLAVLVAALNAHNRELKVLGG